MINTKNLLQVILHLTKRHVLVMGWDSHARADRLFIMEMYLNRHK